MKHTLRRILSGALALTMMMTATALASAAIPEPKGTLVAIGDSMTFHFPGRHEWEGLLDQTYAAQLARQRNLTLDETLALPSVRATDILALLTDYEGDEYTAQRSAAYATATREAAVEAVRNASVITVNLGYSALAVELISNLLGQAVIADGVSETSTAFEQIFTDEEADLPAAYAARAADAALSLLKGANALTGYVLSGAAYHPELLPVAEALTAIGNGAIDLPQILQYVLTSQMLHFDRMIEAICAINPDAELIVIGLTNTARAFNLRFAQNGVEWTLSLGALADVLLDTLNTYYQVVSPETDRYLFVANRETPENFLEGAGRDENLADRYLAVFMKEAFRSDSPALLALKPLLMEIGSDLTLDAGGLLDAVSSGLLDNTGALLTGVVTKIHQGEALTAAEKAAMQIVFIKGCNGMSVHPTQTTHDAIYRQITLAEQSREEDLLAAAFRVAHGYVHAMTPLTRGLMAMVQTTVEQFSRTVPFPIPSFAARQRLH